MSNKKDYPLTILKSLEEFVDLKGEKFLVKSPEKNLLNIVDVDDNSNFSFVISEYKKDSNNQYVLLLDRAPFDENNTKRQQLWILAKDLRHYFNSWLTLLNQYDNTKSFFDDPILKSFQEEYFAEFEITDEEAYNKPLTSKQILLIDDYLSKIEIKIDDYKNENNEEKIEEIKSNIVLLRENLTLNSKIWVLKNLTTIWAKVTKLGPKFMKEFVSEANKEIIKQGVKGLIDLAKDNFHNLIP